MINSEIGESENNKKEKSDLESFSLPENAEKPQFTSESQLKTLFDEIPLGIYLVDSNLRIKFVNPTALPVFSLVPNLIGRDFDEVIHLMREKGYADEIVRLFRHTLETGESYYAPEQLIKGQTELTQNEFFEWQINRISLAEGGYGVVCYFREVSASVHTRLAIAQSKDELLKLNQQIQQQAVIFNTTLSTITDYVYRLDQNGRFIYANQALLDLWGIKEIAPTGISMAELNYPKEVETIVLQSVRRVFETKQPVKDQTAYKSPTGASEYHEFIFNPVFGEDGSVDFIIGSSRDISEHKKLELALKEADKRKDEFLATLAHELRNPLAPIRTGLDIIKRFVDDVPPTVKNALDIIERQTNQMVRLVDDLLDISRITQGKIKLQKEKIDLKTAISMAIETCRHALDSNRHEFTLILPQEPIYLNADLTRISQIILNVLNNAAKYTPAGGRISLTVEKEEFQAVIKIRDNGIGIQAELLSRVFDLFDQLETVSNNAKSGLGIGLSVAKELTEMHNGTISVVSDGKNKGSEFTIKLPLAVEIDLNNSNFEFSEITTEDPPQTRRKKILVVDDNKDAAEMLKVLLEMEGFEVLMVFDAETAIEKVKDFKPLACLCDIGLPIMNGYDLAKEIRRIFPEVLLISISGWGQDEDRRLSKIAGFNQHLVKPVSFEALLDSLQQIEEMDE